MKKGTSYLLLAFTLLLTLAGAALPYVTARGQDARVAREDTVRSLDAVELNLWAPTGICETLSLLDESSRLSPLSGYPGQLHLSAEEAESAAWDAIWAMRQAGLLEAWNGTFPLSPSPALLTAGDGEGAAAVWLCGGEDSGYQLVLDDATGQMVSVYWESPWIDEIVAGETYDSHKALLTEACAARLEQWAQFCEDYYARDLSRVERSLSPDSDLAGGQECRLRFVLRDGSEGCTVRLMLWDTVTAFNF